MQADLESLRIQALTELAAVASPEALEAWRVTYLGRQGRLPALLERMKDLSKEERPMVGRLANAVKSALQTEFDQKRTSLDSIAEPGPLDPTLPGRAPAARPRHVLRQTMERMIDVFRRMGFALADGPEIETEFHNFDALNTPPNHPARNEQDTFYLHLNEVPAQGRRLLRSQTSPVQIRVMQSQQPPIRIIAPGRCYRRDEIDATHGAFFHQMEGLYVAEGVSLADLKGTLEFFLKEFLGDGIRVRFRPHFFPFTEPSFEVDLSRPGQTVRGKEWLEICGCGMVDPSVFEHVGIDPERYTGFAFGFGIERMAMMLHGIPDLRFFTENDARFLGQFQSASAA
ncbi:MAG: phenylalanine--tRNA ligase subunit alpha [Candidatus Methylacidiphilales bacterium]